MVSGAAKVAIGPSDKPLTVGTCCTPESGDGVSITHGGDSTDYSLYLAGGEARFAVRDRVCAHSPAVGLILYGEPARAIIKRLRTEDALPSGGE